MIEQPKPEAKDDPMKAWLDGRGMVSGGVMGGIVMGATAALAGPIGIAPALLALLLCAVLASATVDSTQPYVRQAALWLLVTLSIFNAAIGSNRIASEGLPPIARAEALVDDFYDPPVKPTPKPTPAN